MNANQPISTRLTTAALLAASCATLLSTSLMTTSAFAADVFIKDANFESTTNTNIAAPVAPVDALSSATVDLLDEGGLQSIDAYIFASDLSWGQWDSTQNGGPVVKWNPGVAGVHDTGVKATDGTLTGYGYVQASGTYRPYDNRFFDVSWGGTAYEGLNVGVAHTRNDTTASGQLDPLTPRTFEAITQQLTETFDSTAKYTLTVAVGQLSDDAHAEWRDVDGVNTSYYQDESFAGYNVGFLAGGVRTTGSTYVLNHTGATVIAEDESLTAIETVAGAGGWTVSTVNYTPGISPDASALDGQQIMIRMAALESGDLSDVQMAAFDDVKLTKIVAGDADEDDAIGFSDLNIVLGNYNQAGKTWNTGDFDGNGTTGFSDLNTVLGKYNTVAASTAPSFEVASAVASGEVQLVVNADGSLTLEGDTASILSYQITSASGILIPDGDGSPADSGFTLYASNTSTDVTALNFGTTTLIDGLVNIDPAISSGDLAIALADLGFSYGIEGGATIVGSVQVVPEPSSLALLGLGGLLIARRRRG